MSRWRIVGALAGSVLLTLAGLGVGYAAMPTKTVIRTVLSPSPYAVTTLVTETATTTATTVVNVPSPVYVTVTPVSHMSQLEARAYCEQLAVSAFPDSTETDPSLQQLVNAYNQAARERAFQQCMSEHGF